MKTLLLNSDLDLSIDVSGNIATIDDPVSLAQDAASAILLFKGELWYDTTQGVPYFADILGKSPNIPLMKAKFVAAALTVPGVVSAKCFISSIADRTVRGQIQVTDSNGNTTAAAF